MGLTSEIIGSALRLFLWAFIELKALCLCWHSCIKAFFLLVIKKNITLRVLRRERIRYMQILLRFSHMHKVVVIKCRLLAQAKHCTGKTFSWALSIFFVSANDKQTGIDNEASKWALKSSWIAYRVFSIRWTPSFDCEVTRIFSSSNITNCQRKVTIRARRTAKKFFLLKLVRFMWSNKGKENRLEKLFWQ